MAGPLRAILSSRSELGPGLVDLRFALGEPPRLAFRAGQFVTIIIGHDAAGETIKRSYSIASPSSEGESLRFIVRLIQGGPAAAFLGDLAPGAAVAMTGPHGFFVLDDRHPGHVVFAVTGTGIAPVIPMLYELAAQASSAARRVDVFWGARHAGDLVPRADVETACRAAGAALRIQLTQPPPGWSEGAGRIVGPVLDALPALASPTFYLCGNGAMIEELKTSLVARGVDRKKQIRTEAFFG